MDINTILLTVAALLPSAILLIYVYKKDKVEKEPRGLLLKLFLLGALSCGPAIFLEEFLTGIIDGFFESFGDYNTYHYAFIYNFVGIALVEEGLKWGILRLYAFSDKNYNCLFDGLIYAVFVSLGFASLENILYVLNNGWINALTRGILSVPGHMFFSVMMGLNLSGWHIFKKAKNVEDALIKESIITNKKRLPGYKKYAFSSLLIPVILHGFFNFCLSVDSTVLILCYIVFIIALYVISFKAIKKMSQNDKYEEFYVEKIIKSEYNI